MAEASRKPQTNVLALPLAFIALLAAFGAIPIVRENPRFLWSFWLTTLGLLVWNGVLWLSARRRQRALTAHFVMRRAHWIQLLTQFSVYVYWGWYWRQVYHSAYLIVAQVIFAYAFDMLVAWSQGDEYELGFGPFPIILSMNLFLWFKPDWFYWQFAMVAIGAGAKRLVRWKKDGRLAHIFNPSSLPLAIMSIGLLLTGTTDLTWGNEIANTIAEPPHMYVYLFLVALPVQFFFGVATMTVSALISAFALDQLYHLITGTYFFLGPIATAVLLGMLLLITDPATSPKSELGRIIFGALYGLGVLAVYAGLELLGQPTFYDKLMVVPLLNLAIRAIDRFARSSPLARFDPARLAPGLDGQRRNLAIIGAWAIAFFAVLALHGLGDGHPATRLPYWINACNKHLRNGCKSLEILENDLCERGGAWACNEYGIRVLQPGHPTPASATAAGKKSFERACQLGFQAGCANLQLAALGPGELRHQAPRPEDYTHLIDNRGLPARRTVYQELTWACEQGWSGACDNLKDAVAPAQENGLSRKQQLETGCAAGDLSSCQSLGLMYRRGDGVPRDEKRALACTLGLPEGCVGTP